MFGGLDLVFGLQVNFNINKIESNNYGFECWKIFWSCFDMNIFPDIINSPPFDLLSGDSDGDTFSICIEALAMISDHQQHIDNLKARLSNNDEFKRVAQLPDLEDYSSSMLFNSFSPFNKILKIKWGKMQTDNEDIAHSAIESFKLYKPD